MFGKGKNTCRCGADINFVNEYGGGNPLKEALLARKEDIVKYLLIEKKADYRNPEKITTIYGDIIDIVFKLRGWTFPLDSEDYKVKMEIVEYLKEQGVDYRSSPIPTDIQRRYTQEYLDRY